MIDLGAMTTELIRDEAIKLVVYDDATGEPIVVGTTVRGHPTIGIGRALDVHGITSDEASYLLQNDIARTVHQLGTLDWFDVMDAVRQRAVVNMAFQMGFGGVSTFHTMISCIRAQDWHGAAAAALQSRWATQTPERAARVTKLLESGIA